MQGQLLGWVAQPPASKPAHFRCGILYIRRQHVCVLEGVHKQEWSCPRQLALLSQHAVCWTQGLGSINQLCLVVFFGIVAMCGCFESTNSQPLSAVTFCACNEAANKVPPPSRRAILSCLSYSLHVQLVHRTCTTTVLNMHPCT
jgi:hypothetical protein